MSPDLLIWSFRRDISRLTCPSMLAAGVILRQRGLVMASGVRLLTVCLVCCAGLAVSPAVGLAAGSSSGGSESLSSSPLAVPAADGPTATPEASNGETPAIAVEGPGSDGTTPFGTTPFGATPFAPPPEGKTGCQTFGIRAPTFTYNGELMNLPFEGYITCNAAFAQTGQAVLKNASGSSVKFVGYASRTLPVYVHLNGLAVWL